jgi:hypothetical protein
MSNPQSGIIQIGEIIQIIPWNGTVSSIICNMPQELYNQYFSQIIVGIGGTQGSFIMFSKDNKANISDVLGYYASVELRNNSKTEAELFNVGATFFESSK